MASEPSAVLIRQRDGAMPAQFGARLLAEAGREFGSIVVVEGHERRVDGGVPYCRQQQTVMHVERSAWLSQSVQEMMC
jgi:hypothetical protein